MTDPLSTSVQYKRRACFSSIHPTSSFLFSFMLSHPCCLSHPSYSVILFSAFHDERLDLMVRVVMSGSGWLCQGQGGYVRVRVVMSGSGLFIYQSHGPYSRQYSGFSNQYSVFSIQVMVIIKFIFNIKSVSSHGYYQV